MRARTRGSCRFDPYLKVQWWDARALAWRDVQRSWPEAQEPEARAAAASLIPPEAERWRLMRVSMEGRAPLA